MDPVCGNGVVEDGEQCDDGNESNQDGCCNTCLFCDLCNTEYGASCDATDLCCDTPEDRPTACASTRSGSQSRCLLPCATAADCYWSNECDTSYPGHCWIARCGPGMDGSPLNGPCPINGVTGLCYPEGLAEGGYGLCLEPGTLPAGAPCDGGWEPDRVPRNVARCATGICTHWRDDRPTRCLDVCDPVAAYDATPFQGDGCPAGTNCLNFSTLTDYSGARLANRGHCVPMPATDPDGLLACDLLNGELIHHRSQRCDELLPGTRCGLFLTGSLMGTCQPADASPLGLGATCATDATALPCPAGALCMPADPFGSEDATEHACLEVCDGLAENWTCTTAGMECTSLSHGMDDDAPTRLGLCAPSPSAP